MIDWVHEDCIDWGRYMRKTPAAWPSKSTEYKFYRERGADRGTPGPCNPEWDWPENVMAIHRAFRQMPEDLRNTLHVSYVRKAAPESKAKLLGVSKSKMYELRSHCHYFCRYSFPARTRLSPNLWLVVRFRNNSDSPSDPR